MEHNEHRKPGFEPVPLHIPAVPIQDHPQDREPSTDDKPKPEMDIDKKDSDSHGGRIVIGRDGKTENDTDDRDDDRRKEWE